MKPFQKIRQLFTPIQPTVKKMEGQVAYQEMAPDLALQHYIYCYWILKTEIPLEQNYTYRVVADGCIDVFFELSRPRESFVMGFCKKYTEFELDNQFHYVGIRFLPTIFPQLFKVDAAELSNQSQPLELVVPLVAQHIAQHFNEECSPKDLKIGFDKYFIQFLAQVDFEEDDRFYNALDIILSHQGVLQVEKDLNTGLSPRQLRRKFNYFIGTSPKTFGKVVRFQNILRAKPSTQSLRKNKLFFDVGYYDQAHFIKEFKHLYGVKPSTAFGR